ncbi:MAG: SDR family NAD(P)-dependent oxidoreductase [Chloroflexi bacterium]|nr:SDR family NAD(P)-dependent oxidoreductase [Chloroflexota bacterium]
MRELDGRVALVTGGGSGIGRGIALALSGAGMRVVVADIERDAAEAVAAEIAASGGESSAETLDVTDPAAVEALAARCDERYGGIDVLCNNAGVLGPTPIGPDSLDNWRWTMDVNVLGVVHVLNAFVPRMRASIGDRGGEAHVVNTASIGGLIAGYGWEISAYIASKFAVVSMSRNLRGDLAGSGIGVSVLCPGSVDTRIWEAARNRPAEYGGPEAYDWPDRIARSGPIDPLLVGRHVLRAIREDQFYVITHTEGRAVIEADAREVLDAFDRADRDPLD